MFQPKVQNIESSKQRLITSDTYDYNQLEALYEYQNKKEKYWLIASAP